MKRVFVFSLTFLMLLNLSACSGAQAPAQETAPAPMPSAETTPETGTAAAVPETEPMPEGDLFLKVSPSPFLLWEKATILTGRDPQRTGELGK